MGSWNETCMVTNLPILVGDPVICQVIVAAPFVDPLQSAANSVYPHDRFVPVGWPFRAKYNDYGYVEKIEEDRFTEDTLDYMRNHLIERPLGENRYHDHEVRKDKLSWESLDSWFHGKRVLIGNPVALFGGRELAKYRSVGMVMIHEPVYKTMTTYRDPWWSGTIAADIREGMEAPPEPFNDLIMPSKLNRYLRDHEMNNPRRLDGDREETIKRLVEMAHFDEALSAARRQWAPTSGAGSQSEQWELFRKINEAGEIVAKKREAELAQYIDEDEDA